MASPGNLDLDSDIAEWSFSMATPLNSVTVKESPLLTVATSNASVTEDEFECPTTDESILALRQVLGNPASSRPRSFKRPVRESKGGMVRVVVVF